MGVGACVCVCVCVCLMVWNEGEERKGTEKDGAMIIPINPAL